MRDCRRFLKIAFKSLRLLDANGGGGRAARPRGEPRRRWSHGGPAAGAGSPRRCPASRRVSRSRPPEAPRIPPLRSASALMTFSGRRVSPLPWIAPARPLTSPPPALTLDLNVLGPELHPPSPRGRCWNQTFNVQDILAWLQADKSLVWPLAEPRGAQR